tara:strand:- start:160 stop:354 length:195 start_codon:yes stop_codon:yes gene_type:complete
MSRLIDVETIEFQNVLSNAIGDALNEHLKQIEGQQDSFYQELFQRLEHIEDWLSEIDKMIVKVL